MPYTLSIKQRGTKNVYCMTSKKTGKTYCYNSPSERLKGMQQHEMFSQMKAKGTLRKK